MAPPRLSPRAGVATAAAVLAAGEADAMIALDRPVVAGALAAHPELRLVEFAGWWRGAARLALLPRRDDPGRSLFRPRARGRDVGHAAGADPARSATPKRDRATGPGRPHRGPLSPHRRDRPRDRRRTRSPSHGLSGPASRGRARDRDPRNRRPAQSPSGPRRDLSRDPRLRRLGRLAAFARAVPRRRPRGAAPVSKNRGPGPTVRRQAGRGDAVRRFARQGVRSDPGGAA